MWTAAEKEMLDKLRAQQAADAAKSRKALDSWKAGSEVDPKLLSPCKCPACDGTGKAQVQSRRSEETWTVDLYRCSEVRCNTCYGTGKMRADLLNEMLKGLDLI